MKKTGAWLAVHAMEQIGLTHTFGIPGVHNTEIYDELNKSNAITPVLVTHEGGGAFMADGVSRASDGAVGALMIVPAAGFTHAASGIGEAFLDGVPMLVFSGGVRTDTGRAYQLHDIDQMKLAAPLTKAAFRVTSHRDVIPTIHEAYRIATSGVPGPVLVEIPVNIQLFAGEVDELPAFSPAPPPAAPDAAVIARIADRLLAAKRPGVFVGWGARAAQAELIAIAERLQAPVATTLQGLGVFPGDHPLHAGFGFSPSAVPAARNAFRDCDGLLAVGTRFAEIPTGSFNAPVPAGLIHIDIDPRVIGANHPAEIGLVSDAKAALAALAAELARRGGARPTGETAARIAGDKAAYRAEWLAHDSKGRINPQRFFDALRKAAPDDCVTVLDDGNHTFLTAELFTIRRGGKLLTPTDFNAMGYATPAAIGAKLAQPEREVFAVIGDGCFMMTCMEILTASNQGLGIVFFVFNDGSLSQIAQAQQIPYNRQPCTGLSGLRVEGVAMATGAAYVALGDDAGLDAAMARARTLAAKGQPVIVDVAIDYSKRTAFTTGTARSTFKRFPLSERLRFAGRALLRRVTG
jgi:acetolactate synthase-1/2/3 large subunit